MISIIEATITTVIGAVMIVIIILGFLIFLGILERLYLVVKK